MYFKIYFFLFWGTLTQMYKPQLALLVAFRRRVAWDVEPVEYFG